MTYLYFVFRKDFNNPSFLVYYTMYFEAFATFKANAFFNALELWENMAVEFGYFVHFYGNLKSNPSLGFPTGLVCIFNF